jgi:hypothetical protein
MARNLTIPYYRPTFVEKTLGEVGDGTAWPIEATVDQVAEIYYRVRNAKFTQGDFDFGFGLTFAVKNASSVPSSATPFEENASPGVIVWRGYGNIRSDTGGVDVPAYGQQFFSGETTSGTHHWRASLDDELVVFYVPVGGYNMDYPDFIYPVSNSLPTGFSFAGVGSGGWGSVNAFGALYDGQTFVRFSGEVAWVDSNSSGDPLDPLNSRYIGVSFFASLFSFTFVFTDQVLYGAGLDTGAKFILELSGGVQLLCPIYSDDTAVSTPSDVILKAIEWWPYAFDYTDPVTGDVTSEPVWDADYGTKIIYP